MDQRTKSGLLVFLFILALVTGCSGWAAEGGAIAAKDGSSSRAAALESKTGRSMLAATPGGEKRQGTPTAPPPQAAGAATGSTGAAAESPTEPPVNEQAPAAETQSEGPTNDSAHGTQPAGQTPAPDAEELPAALSEPETGGESRQPSYEDAIGGDVGEVPMPPAETVIIPVTIEPDFVRALTDIAAGRNDSNPVWSPSGSMIAFERSIGDNREIIVARSDGSIIQRIQCRPADDDGEMEFFMPGILEETSYNSGISWSPDENRLVFMSNGGSGNYDLYLLPTLGKEKTIRLTQNSEKDSHPHWSPVDERLAFVSGRTGKAEVYLMDLVSRQTSVLTNGTKTYLYPQWSPDGHKLALMYGSNENHDIYVIEDLQQAAKTLKALTTWEYDDLRPAWSPDGSKIAFYSNYNPAGDPKLWSIIVVAADGSDPTAGDELAARVVAHNVVPDVERGPAWMPDSRRIVFVRNDPKTYNPIHITDIDNPGEMSLRTQTRMNHDVVCSKTGILAFRSQTEQWDHIYIARLKEEGENRKPK